MLPIRLYAIANDLGGLVLAFDLVLVSDFVAMGSGEDLSLLVDGVFGGDAGGFSIG